MSVLSKDRVDVLQPKGTLKRKTRVGETLIQGLLFFSGFVSIFTTLGIVYELGK